MAKKTSPGIRKFPVQGKNWKSQGTQDLWEGREQEEGLLQDPNFKAQLPRPPVFQTCGPREGVRESLPHPCKSHSAESSAAVEHSLHGIQTSFKGQIRSRLLKPLHGFPVALRIKSQGLAMACKAGSILRPPSQQPLSSTCCCLGSAPPGPHPHLSPRAVPWRPSLTTLCRAARPLLVTLPVPFFPALTWV